jgi:hypothetical protein
VLDHALGIRELRQRDRKRDARRLPALAKQKSKSFQPVRLQADPLGVGREISRETEPREFRDL